MRPRRQSRCMLIRSWRCFIANCTRHRTMMMHSPPRNTSQGVRLGMVQAVRVRALMSSMDHCCTARGLRGAARRKTTPCWLWATGQCCALRCRQATSCQVILVLPMDRSPATCLNTLWVVSMSPTAHSGQRSMRRTTIDPRGPVRRARRPAQQEAAVR